MGGRDGDDRVHRAITDDGAFRVITCRTADTVRAAIAAQNVRGPTARVFADLLTGTTLVRETMAPDHRVQGILQSADRRSRMVADSHPEGMTRGLVQLGQGAEMPAATGGLLQMMRTLRNGAIHQGFVEVPREGGVSAALMEYMQTSEQVFTVAAVGCVFGSGDSGDGSPEVLAAGGYIVQLLPEVGEGPLAVMTERLRDFSGIDHLLERGAAEPEELLSEILYGMPFTHVGDGNVHFGCNCSSARVTASLATLPRADIESFITDGKVLEVACDYCRRQYEVAPESLRGLLQAN